MAVDKFKEFTANQIVLTETATSHCKSKRQVLLKHRCCYHLCEK